MNAYGDIIKNAQHENDLVPVTKIKVDIEILPPRGNLWARAGVSEPLLRGNVETFCR